MLNCEALLEKLPQINQNICLLKMNSKSQTFDSSYSRGKSHSEEDGTQNYSVFQPIHGCLKLIANTKYISEWKSKGLSDESIKPPSASDNSLSPLIMLVTK